MKYRYLGKSGLLVSRACLGTMTFGAKPWGCDEKDSRAILLRYIEAGGNFIDTADVYAGGESESIIGSILPELKRDEVLIASKCYFPMSQKPNAHGWSRKHVITSCENSLRRLKTDYIDIYYLHGPDPLVPMEEVLETLDILVRQGKILYTACSNLFGWQIAKAMELSRSQKRNGFVCGQYLYNLIHRDVEGEVIPAMVDSGVGVLSWSPLGGGVLTGKYKGMKEPPAGSRLEHRIKVDGPRFWNERGFQMAEKLEAISKDTGISMAKLALAWPLTRKFLSSVIIGVRTLAQLEENLEATDWDMPEDIQKRLEEISAPEKDYLWWFNGTNYKKFLDAAEHLFPGTGAGIDLLDITSR
jgi:aryl-alcohol dehydrogenase-like predicted oxidoreductase